MPTLERATKFNPMFESDPVTAQYYRRYDDDVPQYHRGDRGLPHFSSSASVGNSCDLSSEEIQSIYQNTSLTKEVRGGKRTNFSCVELSVICIQVEFAAFARQMLAPKQELWKTINMLSDTHNKLGA